MLAASKGPSGVPMGLSWGGWLADVPLGLCWESIWGVVLGSDIPMVLSRAGVTPLTTHLPCPQTCASH